MILLAAIAVRFVHTLPVSEAYAYRMLYEMIVECVALYGLITLYHLRRSL